MITTLEPQTNKRTLQSLYDSMHKGPMSNPYNRASNSDYYPYLIAYALTYGSSLVEKSNFEVMLERLGGEDGENVHIEHFNGWSGNGKIITINPNDETKIKMVLDMLDEIDDYPLLDEDHHSELREKTIQEMIKDIYSNKGFKKSWLDNTKNHGYVRNRHGLYDYISEHSLCDDWFTI